jgi:hypothetical protein
LKIITSKWTFQLNFGIILLLVATVIFNTLFTEWSITVQAVLRILKKILTYWASHFIYLILSWLLHVNPTSCYEIVHESFLKLWSFIYYLMLFRLRVRNSNLLDLEYLLIYLIVILFLMILLYLLVIYHISRNNVIVVTKII